MTNIKRATQFFLQPLPEPQTVILSFRTTPEITQVEIDMQVAKDVVGTLVQCLAANPNDAARKEAVQMLSVRNIQAGSFGGMPVLSYELEVGIEATTSIDLKDAIRLRDQLNAAIAAASAPGPVAH